ncbi:Bacteriophage coat protein B [Azotobacter beijerinckii]|uniref:Bacteriophage coat protein B n=1 Tax=Azotobacter beijerinckii TaxID=170623 RepID=A0A1H8YZJ9_9GAMM|nr:major capsid protein [Azotobacter beijerinckii]SEP57546.1 Bacteriophage coat protein B [Azotobacter beijerinckii]
MKLFNTARKYGSKIVLAGTALAVSSGAFAALDAGVTTAMGDTKADVTTLGGLVLGILIAAAAFKYLRRGL